jgi:5-methylcytosine-specific restriction endonuclease McrA
MQAQNILVNVSDDALIRQLGELVSQSRRVEADLVAHSGEVEARCLYAREASPSMFAYCTERLHLSEAEAYARIAVARAARRHPALLAMLRDGRLHLSGLVRLMPHLTAENRDRLLERATHKSKRQIEELVAELFPRPDVPTVVRKLPLRQAEQDSTAATGLDHADEAALELCPGRVAPASPHRASPSAPSPLLPSPPPPPASPPAPLLRQPGAKAASAPFTASTTSRPAAIEPLAPARYKVQFTASAELRRKLERLQALMRSEVPDGDLATVIEHAVSEKLERLEARRFAKTSAPRKGLSNSVTSRASRHIPAAVRRAVLERDGSRCGYVDEQGRRCTERDRLEFHHRHPFGMGGDHSPANLGLRCRIHNLLQAESDFGVRTMRKHRRPDTRAAPTA